IPTPRSDPLRRRSAPIAARPLHTSSQLTRAIPGHRRPSRRCSKPDARDQGCRSSRTIGLTEGCMFPLDLPGPQFLVFYGLFAVAVIAVLHFTRQRRESLPLPRIDPQDPYLFACLRGGPREVACIATLALIDRGLLQISGRMVRCGPNAQSDLARRQ